MNNDTLMCHSLSANTLSNATRFSHNSIQGHHHSKFGVEYYADKVKLRWSMSTGCLVDPNGIAAKYAAGAVHTRSILGSGLLLSDEGDTLVISDMHLPYQHEAAFDFLDSLNNYYDFKYILNVGDLYDHHAGSYHESEPGAYSPEEEFMWAAHYAAMLQGIFPKMVITTGNHDAIPQRKLKSCGLPSSMLSDYNAMYTTDEGWEFKDEHWFDSKGAFPAVVPMRLNKRGKWDGKILCP